jgi:hypothetical protein
MNEQWIFYLDAIIPAAIFFICVLIIVRGNKQ